MQTLRKKNSPCKFKNEPTRFLGEGVSFKAKLIGILEVSEARGDRMCQAALADLKMAIRAAGEHKQRIAVQVSIDGLRLRDEKTSECLYHHPVHKISFIAQDMSDSRAFGYIFGSPDTGHRFFGIKTDKAASQVVIAMRDLFQVVFELKKKEIELAKQHIEQNAINAIKFHTGGMFVEPAPDTKGAAGTESSVHRTRLTNSETEKATDRKNENQSGVIADLLDLQFELNSLQQGIHQMDKITPEQPGPATDDLFESDPFGDSFANMKLKDTVQPILPPPPSSAKRGHLERQQTVPAPTASSATSSPAATLYSKTPPPQETMHWFDKETENLFNDGELTNPAKTAAVRKDQDEASTSLNATPRSSQAKSPQIDVFTELDPLGTGLIKPYVDKKDFFQHLKNPPKKVLKDLVTTNSTDTFPTNFNLTSDTPSGSIKLQNDLPLKESDRHEEGNFANFDRFDENEATQSSILPRSDSPQKKDIVSRPTHHQPLSVSLPPEETPTKSTLAGISSVNAPTAVGGTTSVAGRADKDSNESVQALVRLPSPKKYLQSVRKREFDMDLPSGKSQSIEKPFPVDFSTTSDSPASPLRSCSSDANSRLSSSSAELDLVPEPPPRGAGSIMINPPPLPPKKQAARGSIKPPPRPPYTEGHFHYDFIEREVASPSPTRTRERTKSPPRDAKGQFDDNFSPPSQASARTDLISTMTTSAFEDSFSSMIPATNLSTFFASSGGRSPAATRRPKPSLDITLSQLTSANLDELAGSLGMTVQELTSLTLQQLTECLANLSSKESATEAKEEETARPRLEQFATKPSASTCKITETSFVSSEPLFKANFDQEPTKKQEEPTYDKYAVFRELLEMERMQEEEPREETNDEEVATDTESKEPEERKESEEDETRGELTAEAIVAMANLTVKLPPSTEELAKEDSRMMAIEETNGIETDRPIGAMEALGETKDDAIEVSTKLQPKTEGDVEADIEEDTTEDTTVTAGNRDRGETSSDKGSEANGVPDKVVVPESSTEDVGRSSVAEKTEVRSSTSTSSDRYAALREIIGETERLGKQNEEESSSRRESPVVVQQQASSSKNLAEAELLSLFSDSLPTVPPSPRRSLKKKEDDLKSVAMDIFEEIKMLNTGTHKAKEVKAIAGIAGFEDVFCPFAEEVAKDNGREDGEREEDGNWAKFETSVLGSDRSSCEGARSVGGTSPWSPDGKDFHRDVPPFKSVASTSGVHRHSGDSDNEWKDEEESEESNGRGRPEGRFWCGRHPRFDAAEFDERSFYEEASASLDNRSDKRDRSFRGRAVRKSRGPWAKNVGHRPRDPSRWHEKPQWEEVPRRYPHRKLPYKENDDHYDVHDHLSRFWKCRPKSQRWNWIPDDAYYDEERRRKMTERKLTLLWNEEDRFGSEESVGFEEDDRWAKRKYERRRWDEDYGRYWNRRSSPPLDGEYPSKEGYYYYRESRERPHDYASGAWDEEYGPERVGDESGRYNTVGRKRHWPKRPNSANEGRNTEYGEMVYADARSKFGTSRSECSDNDSDPYLRPSQRSRSRESYWGSDQEYDSWPERPYWSEGPDVKSETLHRKRVARHKAAARQAVQAKTQSPFEDDFAQSIEQVESPASETLPSAEPRVRPEIGESKRGELIERPPPSPSATPSRLSTKEVHPRREMPREYNKRSTFFEDDLTPTASVSTSDASDRRRLSSDLKATPEEIPPDAKDSHRSIDGFVSEDSGRDSFFNGDLRFDDDDAFTFKSELEDSVPERCTTTLPLKNARQNKYAASNSNNKGRPSDQYIRKSESVNIFIREEDPFDDDDFFN
ncbi:protein disabled [Vespula pensylvanica]|uniref:protein disabled n=1 Tax=Vespula pensylvanica TaxID=30213 RepID=UPI001CB9E01F|nr:protein disabled [Vespula pensylvanica]